MKHDNECKQRNMTEQLVMLLLMQEVLCPEDSPVCYQVASRYSLTLIFTKESNTKSPWWELLNQLFIYKCEHTLAEGDILTDMADFRLMSLYLSLKITSLLLVILFPQVPSYYTFSLLPANKVYNAIIVIV